MTSNTGGETVRPVRAARRGWATLPSFWPVSLGEGADRRLQRGDRPIGGGLELRQQLGEGGPRLRVEQLGGLVVEGERALRR